MSTPDVLAGGLAAEPAPVPSGTRGVDERAGVWTVLLPAAAPARVVLAGVPAETVAVLARRYPHAVTVADPADAPDGIDLLVCSVGLRPALEARLAPGATVAVLGGRRTGASALLVPDPSEPTAFVLPGVRTLRRGVPVTVTATGPTLAETILAEVGTALGRSYTLAEIRVGASTILRGACPAGDVAVRVAVTSAAERGGAVRLREVTAAGPPRSWLPRELAAGLTSGCRWAAYAWAGEGGGRRAWTGDGAGWAVSRQVAAELGERRTGVTGPGWVEAWLAPAEPFGPEVRAAFARLLAALPEDTPTAWCHGDLWSGNVLFSPDGRATVVDWDNARPDAPAGLDGVLVEAWRRLYVDGLTFGEACAALCAPDHDLVVGGRDWAAWSDAERRGLVAAAFLLHAWNRDVTDLDDEWRAANLVPFVGADLAPAARVATGDLESRAAHGGLWLALSSITSKGMQTLVLLVLARVLAPRQLGVLSIGALVVNIASVVQDLGASDVLTYRAHRVRETARTAVTLLLAGSLAVTAACWVAAPALARFLRAPEGTGVIRGLTAVLPCYAVASVTLALMRREMDFRRRIVPDVVPAVAGGVLSIGLALAHYGVAALVVGQVVQGVLTPLCAWAVGQVVKPGWNRALARDVVSYGRNVVGADVLHLALLNLDYTIVARILGAAPLGLYSLAFRICYLPFVNVTYVINGAAFPYYCRLEPEDLPRAVRRVTAALALAVTPVYAGLLLLAPNIELLGEKWAPAVGAVRWLAVYGLALSFAHAGQTLLKSRGRPDLNLRIRAVHVLALGGTLLVVARSGITTVAAAQAFVAVAVCALTWWQVRRLLPEVRLRRLVTALLAPAAGVAGMYAVLLALDAAGLRDGDELAVAAGRGLAALVAYGLVVWRLAGGELRATRELFRSRG